MRWHVHSIALLVASLLATSATAAEPARKPLRPPSSPPPKTDILLEAPLAGAMRGVEDIVFAARALGKDGHWYANFGYYAADPERKAYAEGGKLYRLNLRTGKLTTLLADPRGGVRDPQVHYDDGRIVFAYRKGGQDQYHLYEINADGSGLRQLTDGPFDDIEPSYLPDGGIVFVSSRCKRWVNCWLTQVAVLHRCDANGGNIRAISSNNEHDNTPWPLPDGRLLYTRWEYVDRSQVHFHHLWTANPDGTSQMTWFGNLNPGTTMIDAKPIPDSHKVVASFSPGHGQREHNGVVTVVDPSAGPDEPKFTKAISKAANYRDPWAFSENCFLAAKGVSLVLLDETGREQKIFSLPDEDVRAELECHEPRPLALRPREKKIPSRIQPDEPAGKMILADVYDGRNMDGVQRGEIKKLLVLESLPMPIHYTGGMEPLTYGGSFTLERIIGTVPVEADGSAYFEVPALRSVFFVALDENDLSVKRMQSFVSAQPGEVTSCVGCHEHRTQTPRYAAQNLAALRRTASKIEPIAGVPDVFDFPRDIQPILDRHCVACHDYGRTNSGGVILCGDRGPMFSQSYFTLTARSQVADGRNRPKSNYPPRALGSAASPLMAKLEPAHYDVQLSAAEKKFVRLWIESGATYAGTYAALGCGMVGSHAENHLSHEDLDWPSTQIASKALERRCGECHVGDLALPLHITDNRSRPPWEQMTPDDPRRRLSRHLIFNLTRPEKSLVLLAPLAHAAGGLGLCQIKATGNPAPAKPAEVFASIEDTDYRAILAAIADAKKQLDTIKRFDMPGFHPRAEWIREMKRYGILPENLPLDAPLDVYSVERAYWESLWYKPAASMSTAGGGR